MDSATGGVATIEARSPSVGLDSRFSTDRSESGDNWSDSSGQDDDDIALMRPSPGKIIGRGAFGSVYKTIWKGQQAALKVRANMLDLVSLVSLLLLQG